ncbi:site-specific DNA-methyltransferase, partial [Salmonella enterica subsp. enterica serovar Lexington]|nr:site-specific DNA-methyltransferase [Salmonella enterica subsp. enterica serovar Lexington]
MNHTIHHGDCLDVMPTLEPGSVDLIVCDPPYGSMKGSGIKCWDESTAAWDIAIEPRALFAVCEHVLRVNGALVLFAQ